jgi:hypothetical protein
MPESIPPLFTDPAAHSPEERTRAVAAILAAGLLRLRRSVMPPETPPPPLRKHVHNLPRITLRCAGRRASLSTPVNGTETQRFPGEERWT